MSNARKSKQKRLMQSYRNSPLAGLSNKQKQRIIAKQQETEATKIRQQAKASEQELLTIADELADYPIISEEN